MKRIVLYSILFIFSFKVIALAQTTIEAKVDKTTLTTDETLTYKLTVTSSDENIPLPQLPKFEGFEVLSQVELSSMSLAKEEAQIKLSFVFILTPTDIGKFKIEPSSIKIKDQTYSSESFQIEVKESHLPKNIPSDINSQQPQINL